MTKKKKEKKKGKVQVNNILDYRDKYSSIVQPYLKLKFRFIRHSYTIVMLVWIQLT